MRWLGRDEFGHFDPDWADCSAYLDAIRSELPSALRAVAEAELHDGLIEKLTINEAEQTVKLRLVVGDLQRGYRRARIKYRGASVVAHGVDLRWLVEYERTELLGDEIEVADSGFAHRLVFWPAGEIHITFEAVEFATTECPDRTRRSPRLRCR